MPIELHVRRKITSFIAQIDGLLLSDFPHSSTESALKLIRTHFVDTLARLDKARGTSKHELIQSACVTANMRIYDLLPILGFLLRSTNVRNNFESYDALLQLSTAIIGPQARVVMSSEWDYSPLTYAMTVSVLPDFVLLGMPTSESSNSLILPLAGHELGHSVWQTELVSDHFDAQLQKAAKLYVSGKWTDFQRVFPEFGQISVSDDLLDNNIFVVNIISEILGLAKSQIEETFCDAVGAQLFGAGYVYAFHYLLAPNLGGYRTFDYPKLSTRADFLNRFSGLDLVKLGFPNYPSEFDDRIPNLTRDDSFIYQAVDNITIDIASEIYEHAKSIVASKASSFRPEATDEAEILQMFRAGVPARKPGSLAGIINAGWQYVRENEAAFNDQERPLFEWVSELILKSIEVMEFNRRVIHA